MSTRNFEATADSMGEWGGREADAAARWDLHVAPVLRDLVSGLPGDEQDPNFNEDVATMRESAWEAFCVGGSRAAIRAARRYAPTAAEGEAGS